MALPPAIASKDPNAVAAHIKKVFAELGWTSSQALIDRAITDVAAAFAGLWPNYRAIDMRYHDFGHTLQATVCITDMLPGQYRENDVPGFGQRAAEMCVLSALLHDSGFLKATDDVAGTGAKYTMVHERRSCEFGRTYLPTLGLTPEEIKDVCMAIACTGPRNRISAHTFSSPVARRIACLLVTADYVAQMSAPDYPEKLDHLFAEFVEAFDHDGVAPELRPYRNATELKLKTPEFWSKLVRPMLDTEADAVHRFLSVTGQPNPYLRAIEDNIAEVRRRAAKGAVHA